MRPAAARSNNSSMSSEAFAPRFSDPIVGRWRKERRARIDAISRASDEHHARRMRTLRHMHGELRERRPKAVEDERRRRSIVRASAVDHHFAEACSLRSCRRLVEIERMPRVVSIDPGREPRARRVAVDARKISIMVERADDENAR